MKGTTDFNQEREFEQNSRINAESESAVIPVIEEQLRVDKKVVEVGSVLISKKVHEEKVSVDVPVIREELDIERIAINQYIDTAPPAIRYEGDKTIIPILKEVVVVEKRLMLVEELHVTKRKVETNTPQEMTLRREEVIVDRVAKDHSFAETDLKNQS